MKKGPQFFRNYHEGLPINMTEGTSLQLLFSGRPQEGSPSRTNSQPILILTMGVTHIRPVRETTNEVSSPVVSTS